MKTSLLAICVACLLCTGCTTSYKCNQYVLNARLSGDTKPTITQTVTGDASLSAAAELSSALKASIDGNEVKDNTATVPLK